MTGRGKYFHKKTKADCVIDVNLQLTSFSSAKRKSQYHLDKDWSLFSANLRDMFEEALLPDVYESSTICIHIVVSQNNGSSKSVIINTVSLALMDAGIELSEPIFSAGAGYIPAFAATPVVDLSYAEETAAQGEIVLAIMPLADKLVFIEAKGMKMQGQRFITMMEKAHSACHQIKEKVEAFLNHHYEIQAALLAN